jgi:MFS transporter, ACS family, DAL5 transporter family protein
VLQNHPHLFANRLTLVVSDSVVIGFVCLGMIVTPLTTSVYSRVNARRALEGDKALESYSTEELAELEDRAPDFRYSL